MGAILDELIYYFESDDWLFDEIDDPLGIQAIFEGRHGKWPFHAYAREDVSQCVLYSVLPVNVPLNKLDSVAEFITRANAGMVIGNFELNYDDGEVRYKTSIDVKGDKISTALIRQMVTANCSTVDHYLSGLMSVIYADIPPVTAISKIEDS